MLRIVETVYVWKGYIRTLFSSQFSVNPKTVLKNKVLIKQTAS